MSELKITATISVKPEYKEDVLTAIRNVVDATRKEAGNISYDLHENINNSSDYVIIEVWKSQEDIDIHNNSSHFAEFKQAINGKIDSLKIDILKKIY